MSKQNWSIDGDFFNVLVNSEGQHSLWPASKEIPKGWEQKGETGTKEECLEKINSEWLDIKPKSLNKKSGQGFTPRFLFLEKIRTLLFNSLNKSGKNNIIKILVPWMAFTNSFNCKKRSF